MKIYVQLGLKVGVFARVDCVFYLLLLLGLFFDLSEVWEVRVLGKGVDTI